MPIVTDREISRTLSRYLARHPGENDSLAELMSSLANDAEITSRRTAPGHVTCSVAVIDSTGRVLMIHHNVLDRWLLPGGHLDPADQDLLAGAQRELVEETGISWQQAVSAPGFDHQPFDIDLHRIPANPAKDEPAHWHADFRFAFFASDPPVLLQLEEVSGYVWQRWSSLHPSRLAAKIARLTG